MAASFVIGNYSMIKPIRCGWTILTYRTYSQLFNAWRLVTVESDSFEIRIICLRHNHLLQKTSSMSVTFYEVCSSVNRIHRQPAFGSYYHFSVRESYPQMKSK